MIIGSGVGEMGLRPNQSDVMTVARSAAGLPAEILALRRRKWKTISAPIRAGLICGAGR
jgi:hypothetical protein